MAKRLFGSVIKSFDSNGASVSSYDMFEIVQLNSFFFLKFVLVLYFKFGLVLSSFPLSEFM